MFDYSGKLKTLYLALFTLIISCQNEQSKKDPIENTYIKKFIDWKIDSNKSYTPYSVFGYAFPLPKDASIIIDSASFSGEIILEDSIILISFFDGLLSKLATSPTKELNENVFEKMDTVSTNGEIWIKKIKIDYNDRSGSISLVNPHVKSVLLPDKLIGISFDIHNIVNLNYIMTLFEQLNKTSK